MNEARRFIRYLIPGIACAVELIIFLYISTPEYVIGLLRENILKEGYGAAILGSVFFGLGGLGYVLATIYHGASKLSIFRQPRHLRFLRNSLNARLIILRQYQNGLRVNEDRLKKLNQIDAWYIMGAFYHARMYKPKFKEAHARIESMNDILHALGAAWIGTIIVTLFWGLKTYYVLCVAMKPWHFFAPLFLLTVITWNYFRTGHEATRIIDGITAQFIVDEVSEKGQIDL